MQQYLTVLENSWFELHRHYHFSEPQKFFNKLIAAYSEKQRAYHTLIHLYECIVLVDSLRADLNDAHAVALALWFHDAVYDPQAKDNELKSAELFEHYLSQDLSADDVQKIKRWIIATQKHEATNERDLQFLLDIDLAILAASPERFDEYEQQIQQEYTWVDPDVYSIKRKQVLAHFYQTEPLYQTEYFQQNLEQRAKQNLNRILNI
ncbi:MULTISPECIES: HD domain-containing protein [Acinetobacter]|jgi:predicted metal-dependent HD superfamily phosphohydrolase|uniref:Metal-dependent hydrolase n=1 Tax=Acinetobacter junii TaxID=40215 RepID=A0AAW5R9G3_ACIJU|nr:MULTISPECIES: metal-dependent hydrolase [Acinetobacter]MBY3625056.1 metal-dependent hydrolase [Acinetobacter sp. CUI P1]MCU4396896.1 metal-dependent hydrolase [Acinetobacter junii]MDA3501477.1 metal-dependent hydrolase [Acinetobacter sp. AOR34_HL]MDI9722081.1 metal-dependent hydrolase [Acinetobacter junii]MDR7653905.1 metal-dependent hydrolase [Acinetobacter junii]